MLAFSFVSNIQLILPGINNNSSLLNIVVYIRDIYDCVTEYNNISSVFIEPDLTQLNNLIDSLQTSNTNSFIQMLASGNQNTVGQIITSVSQQFNTINNQAVQTALASKMSFIIFIPTLDEYFIISDGISVATIAISPLGSTTQQTVSSLFF